MELAQGIKKRIKQNGVLILSGLLEMDRDAIIKAFTSVGFDEVDFMKMDEWIGIVFKSQ
ncbi:MAG: 50S ribosomal protein L11 methyltransferase [Ignavibacterium sp.]